MWGHVQVYENHLYLWFTVFHIHVFLLISGFMLARKQFTADVLKCKVKGMIWPYITFSVIVIAVNAVWNFFQGMNPVKYVVLDGYKAISLYGIFALWYLPSYAVAMGLFYVISKKVKNAVARALLILLALAASVGVNYFLIWASENLNGTVYAGISFPIVSVFRGAACVFFLAAGYAVGEYKLLEKISKAQSAVIGCAMLAVSYFLAVYSGPRNFSTLTLGRTPVLYLLAALLGALGLFLAVRCINKPIPVVNACGRNSLYLMVSHMSLRLHSITQLIVGKFMDERSNFFGLVCLALMLIIEIPIIYLLKGRLNFLMKKSKPFKRNTSA